MFKQTFDACSFAALASVARVRRFLHDMSSRDHTCTAGASGDKGGPPHDTEVVDSVDMAGYLALHTLERAEKAGIAPPAKCPGSFVSSA